MTNLQKSAYVIAAMLFIASVTFNIILYTSFTNQWFYQSAYGWISFWFDVAKVVLLIYAAVLWSKDKITLAVIAFVFWVALTAISAITGYGFFLLTQSQSEQQRLEESAPAKATEIEIEKAQQKVNDLSSFATVNVASQQAIIDSHASTLSAAQQELAKWESEQTRTGISYRTRIGAAQARITDVETATREPRELIEGYTAYQGATTHLKQLKETAATQIPPIEMHHPLFIGLAKIFNSEPASAKYSLLTFTSVVLELLSTFMFLVGGYLRTTPITPMQRVDGEVITPDTHTLSAMRGVENADTLSAMRSDSNEGSEITQNIGESIEKLNKNTKRVKRKPKQYDEEKGGLQILNCDHCGTEFKQRTVWHRFCSQDCNHAHHNFQPYAAKA